MIIDRVWLESNGACEEGKEFFLSEGILSPRAGIRNLLTKEKVGWANWLIVRCMTRIEKVRYAIYAAKQVLTFFEQKYPHDKRPREAINTALWFLKHPTAYTANVADAAANAAHTAADAAANAAANAAVNAAAYAANAAANAAYAATYAAANAAYAAANAAVNAAAYAAYAAANVTYAADATANATYATYVARNKIKIVLYGLRIMRGIK